ncbi:MAG: hypothetical protein FGM62_00735 [Methylobacterium sp.]|nr:hypothetical protein [Methylobacterium sp.]
MNLLDSAWFQRMVEAAGQRPADQLVAVFSVTKQWISAPGIREQFALAYPPGQPRMHPCTELKRQLTGIATSARARQPAVLASQLAILLQGAIAEEMRTPGSEALDEAANAARAVIRHACGRSGRERRALAIGAALAVAGLMFGLTGPHHWQDASTPALLTHNRNALPQPSAVASSNLAISPDEMVEFIALQREIGAGHCPAPQLMVLPPGQATAYMNALNARAPEDPAADRANMRAFLAWFKQSLSTECYYPPSNGHTAVTWVRR